MLPRRYKDPFAVEFSGWQDFESPEALGRINRRKGYALGTFLSLALAVTAWILADVIATREINPADLCPIDTPPSSHTTILIDLTDQMSRSQMDVVRLTLGQYAGQLAVGEKLSLWVLQPAGGQVAKRLFSVCRPSRGAGVSRVTGDPDFAEAQYRERFVAPFEGALGQLGHVQPAARSPIIQAIYTAATEPSFAQAARRRLIVYSDLLQNTPELNQYKLPFPPVAILQSNWLYLDIPALEGATVQVFQLRNAKYEMFQTLAHRAWWQELFASLTGTAQWFRQL